MAARRTPPDGMIEQWWKEIPTSTLLKLSVKYGYSRSFIGRALQQHQLSFLSTPPPPGTVPSCEPLAMPDSIARLIAEQRDWADQQSFSGGRPAGLASEEQSR